ncbi:hypothetical protein OG785_35005 [Streptomyces sp. NBC_00006]|uniref:hypothetical protein n=1 Tax=unclassified Streptomyces TaxID=2593676 RepID=UPI00224F58AD|nr:MULTISPECIES: hypothetical protein [unclassified Streptomyces]MCX5535753.1 hypothetical protein [Streptomyces sp. NBC_00006]
MRITDRDILAMMCDATATDWYLIGDSLYAPTSPSNPQLVISGTLLRTDRTNTAIALTLHALHHEHGELDRTRIDFDQDGDPFEVVIVNHTDGVVRPGPRLSAWWQQAEAYVHLWQPTPGNTTRPF